MQKNLFKYILSLLILIGGTTYIYAQTYDFSIQNTTVIRYTTGQEYVLVQTEYTREVKNTSYYYSTQGEKIFHIPDLPNSKSSEILLERQFKTDSLTVVDALTKRAVAYTVEELEIGEGIYVKVPNYKQTTYNSPYKILVEYKTHDLVKKTINHVVLLAPALHEDTEFEQIDSTSGTKTELKYDLKVITDRDIPPLANIYPQDFKVEEGKDITTYIFNSNDRVGKSPSLEFGTQQIYRFELKYKTPKTDSIVPDRYSSLFKALSTNIYELSLPRDFEETNQRVKIESIYPTPSKIVKDDEGNILAQFEVPANKSSEISVVGYIAVMQDTYSEKTAIPNSSLEEYFSLISQNSELKKYTVPTKYWESSDSYIQQEANKLLDESTSLMDLVKNDYRYVNDKLEYDESKANSDNERMGAKAALQGEASVCMEYADSMIAILRAQGVPARAALGYSNLTTLENSNTGGSTRHQWVQIWVPDYGWLSIDPTYESENMLIGQNIEKILWETFFDEELSNIKIYSADTVQQEDFSNYSVLIYATENLPEENLLQYSDIIPMEEGSESSVMENLNLFVKTTVLGKSLIILLPILLLLGSLIVVLMLITVVARKLKSRKAPLDQQR